ncbi:MAG: Bcr/CflA family drug resistance efflux transporter, partial [Myxococcota bacterium]
FLQGDTFALWFAGVAFAMAMSNLLNARLVPTWGMRRLSHSALIALNLIVVASLIFTWFYGQQLLPFYLSLLAAFACFGLVGANFSAISMQPLGRIAGTGSAAFGFMTSTGSGLLGGFIGRSYDGTITPLLTGYLMLGLAALTVVLITERGRLFEAS